MIMGTSTRQFVLTRLGISYDILGYKFPKFNVVKNNVWLIYLYFILCAITWLSIIYWVWHNEGLTKTIIGEGR